MKKGKLIVIEGTDGSGKGTQTKLLIDFLKKQKRKVFMADFPQYEKFFGKLVGRYLDGEFGDLNAVNPYLASLPYALDRASARDEIKKKLKAGAIVISNRYAFSNMAFQSAKLPTKERPKFIHWDDELEYQINGLPREDIVIFLYVPSQFNQALIDKKATRNYTAKKRDIHESNQAYLKQAEIQYLWLTKHYKHVRKLNCINRKGELRTIEDIHQEIIKILEKEKLV